MTHLSIYDFDQTMTIGHTYNDCKLEKAPVVSDEEIRTNTKIGIKNHFKHNDNELSAIATFHNNPDLIKRHVEQILKKTLTLSKTELSECGNYALNVYDIDESPPFIIAYIPHTGEAFNDAVMSFKLECKNSFLTSICQFYNHAPESPVNYYEDSVSNLNGALRLKKTLLNLSIFRIMPNSLFFRPIPVTEPISTLSASSPSVGSSPFSFRSSPKSSLISLQHSVSSILTRPASETLAASLTRNLSLADTRLERGEEDDFPFFSSEDDALVPELNYQPTSSLSLPALSSSAYSLFGISTSDEEEDEADTYSYQRDEPVYKD